MHARRVHQFLLSLISQRRSQADSIQADPEGIATCLICWLAAFQLLGYHMPDVDFAGRCSVRSLSNYGQRHTRLSA